MCDESSLNQNGSRAAEGITKEFSSTVMGEFDHGCGQSFANRGPSRYRSIAALVKPGASGIQIERGDILENRKLDLIFRAGFWKPREMIDVFESLHNRFFNDALAIRN